MTFNSLLTDTELPENHVQDVLDIDPSQQPPERISRRPQFLRGQLLALLQSRQCCVATNGRLPQQFALTLPADQPALA